MYLNEAFLRFQFLSVKHFVTILHSVISFMKKFYDYSSKN